MEWFYGLGLWTASDRWSVEGVVLTMSERFWSLPETSGAQLREEAF